LLLNYCIEVKLTRNHLMKLVRSPFSFRLYIFYHLFITPKSFPPLLIPPSPNREMMTRVLLGSS